MWVHISSRFTCSEVSPVFDQDAILGILKILVGSGWVGSGSSHVEGGEGRGGEGWGGGEGRGGERGGEGEGRIGLAWLVQSNKVLLQPHHS